MKCEYLPKVTPAEHCYQLEVLQGQRAAAGSEREIIVWSATLCFVKGLTLSSV